MDTRTAHRRHSRRGIVAKGAAVFAAAGLAGCGALGSAGQQSANERQPVEIKLKTWTNIINIPWWEEAVTKFNTKHAADKLSVKMEHVPSDYWTKLKAEYAAGMPPDVIYGNPPEVQDVAVQGMLKDLMPFIKQDKLNLADFNPPAQVPYMWGGKVWGLTCWNDTRVLMINRTLFKNNGLPLPPEDWNGPGWTIDDFLRAAKLLTDERSNRWGLVHEGLSLKRWAWLFGAYYWSDDKVPTRSAFNTNENVRGLQFIRDLDYAHRVMAPLGYEGGSGPFGGWEKMFRNGQAAMVWSGYKMVAAGFTNVTEFEWATAPFPQVPGYKRVANVSPQAFAMVSATKYPKESWVVVQDFSLGEANQIMAVVSSMPAYKKLDVYKISQVPPERRWMIKLLQDAMNTGKPEVPHPNAKLEMLTVMNEETRALLQDKKSAAEAARTGADRVNALFDKYGVQK